MLGAMTDTIKPTADYLFWTVTCVEAMAEPYLKYRTRFTSSLKNELIPLFNQLAAQTRIPKSRLLDEAIEDLLKKYDIEIPENDENEIL